jgi:hypothetical protein
VVVYLKVCLTKVRSQRSEIRGQGRCKTNELQATETTHVLATEAQSHRENANQKYQEFDLFSLKSFSVSPWLSGKN